MSGKRHSSGGKHLLGDIAFVAAILILAAALGLIFYVSNKQDQAESERLETIIANEHSPQINNAKIMSEQIEAAVDQEEKPAGDVEKPGDASDAGDDSSDAPKDKGSEGPQEDAGSEGETVSENETVSETEAVSEETTGTEETTTAGGEETKPDGAGEIPEASPELLASSIVILNGTNRNGMAALWQDKFAQAGYTNLSTGSYRGGAQPVSIVYTKDPEKAAAIGRIIPGILIREGEIPGPFVMSGGAAAPAVIDHYVIIGNNNLE